MSKKKPINLKKLEKMEELTFRNALRLHFDSIAMYKNRSYPTAYFLSILALEELGKASLLDDFVWHSRVDGRVEVSEEQEWLQLMYQHRVKQNRFAGQIWPELPRKVLREIASGKMELDKHSALYVSLPKKSRKVDLYGRILTPFNVKRRKAREQITLVSDYLVTLTEGVIKDLYDVDNPRVERLLNRRLLARLKKRWRFRSNWARLVLSRLDAAA